MPPARTETERALKGISERTLILLVVIAQAESVDAARLTKAVKIGMPAGRWRLGRMLRRLRRRGLIVERDGTNGATIEVTPLGREAAYLGWLTLGVASFEPDLLPSLRADDLKAPFSRHRGDDIL